MNQLPKTKLYLFIVIFFMQSFICSYANSNINDDISQQNNDLSGLNIAITAGPTHEIIDSAKYITTKSLGKMGYAIAVAAAQRGANVTLISGPVHLAVPQGVTCINVESAAEMQKIALAEAVSNDIFIGVATVTDYRPVQAMNRKIKKTENVGGLVLQLVECVDVIASVAHLTENRPFTVGFAAETDNIEQYAQKKLVDKNLDLICANDISKANQGFTSDTNALHLFWKDGDKILPLNQKNLLADQLITEIIAQYRNKLN